MGTSEPWHVINVLDFKWIELKLPQQLHEKGVSLNMVMNPILYILLEVVHLMLEVSEVSKLQFGKETEGK